MYKKDFTHPNIVNSLCAEFAINEAECSVEVQTALKALQEKGYIL